VPECDFPHKDLTGKIIDAAMEVHSTLGGFLVDKVILVELKAVRELTPADLAQLLN
jgi:hypothetical protein